MTLPRRRRRRVAAALAAALAVDAGLALVAGAGAAAAPAAAPATASESASAQDVSEAVATLEIIEPGVSVRKSGKDVFKPAKEGQKLKVGDTIQTDATGFAQVNYTDDSFTRLDVNTTFTIESLTDEEGNRKIKGSVESGQTWNRTSALTENESFEQEGAGATAAVTGTAFLVTCTDALHCTFTSIIDGIQLTTVDGEVQQLDPLEVCDSTEVTDSDANLCAAVQQANLDALLANAWILENLFLDGAAGFEGIIIVEEGEVTSFTPTESTGTEEEEEEVVDPTPPAATPPVINANPVNVTNYGADNPQGYAVGPTTKVISQDERNDVTFVLQASGDSALVFVFTALPIGTFGQIRVGVGGSAVALGTQYAASTVFAFDPVEMEPLCTTGSPTVFSQCFTDGRPDGSGSQPYSTENLGPTDNGDGTVSWYDDFTFYAQDAGGEQSATQTVTLEAVDDHCNEGARVADAVVSDENCPAI